MPGSCDKRIKSDLDILKDDILVDTSDSPNLDAVGNNLGMWRPKFGFWNDDMFRALIRREAVRNHTTRDCLAVLCELLLGPNFTKTGTLVTSEGSPAVIIGIYSEPFNIVDGVNNMLCVEVDYAKQINVGLFTTPPHAPPFIAVEVINEINNVFTALAIDIRAETVTANGGVGVKLVSNSGLKGFSSYITLHPVSHPVYDILGFTMGTYRGRRILGKNSWKLKIDEIPYSLGEEFTQINKSLIIDRFSDFEEKISYCFWEESKRIAYFNTPTQFDHEKWLNFYGTTIEFDVPAGYKEFKILDSTGWPDTYFQVLVNRGENNEETVAVVGGTGGYFQIQDPFKFPHKMNESVEILYKNEGLATIQFSIAEDYVVLVNSTLIFKTTSGFYTILIPAGTYNAAGICSLINLTIPTPPLYAYPVPIGESDPTKETVFVINKEGVISSYLFERGYHSSIEVMGGTANSIFGLVEGTIYRGEVGVEPVLAHDHDVLVTALTLNDTSKFPKADFNILIDKGTGKEESFWVSQNDILGTTGPPNTLIISNPPITSFYHNSGVKVYPGQLQLTPCDWDIFDTKATGEVQIVISEECMKSLGGRGCYLHEEIEPEVQQTTLMVSAVAGDTEIVVPEAAYNIFFGDNDLINLNRIVKITDGTQTEYATIVGLRATKILPWTNSDGSLRGYPAASPQSFLLEDASKLGSPLPAIVSVGRKTSNYEKVSTLSVNENVIVLNGMANTHLWYNDADLAVNPKELIDSIVNVGGNDCIYFRLGSELKLNWTVGATITLLIDTPNFLYGTNFDFIPPQPLGADNLVNGGSENIHEPQNYRWPGPYVLAPLMNLGTRKQTKFRSSYIPGSEGVIKIPYPAEILGWLSRFPILVPSDDVRWGNVPPAHPITGAPVEYIIIDDVSGFSHGTPSGPSDYPVLLSKGDPEEEEIVVDRAIDVPSLAASPTKSGRAPGILALNTVVSSIKNTHKRLNKVYQLIEGLIVQDGSGFDPDGGYLALDYGTSAQEIVKYQTVNGNVITISDDGVTFKYGHPVKLGWCPNEFSEFSYIRTFFCTVTPLSSYSPQVYGYDYPLVIFGDLAEVLLLGTEGTPGPIHRLRAAGIKVVVVKEETP